MDTVIAAPASCEVRAVIRFLHAEGQSAAAGGSGDDSVHVLSVFTPTLRGENV